MASKGKTIRINAGGATAGTRIGINGRHRRIPHNQDVAVSQAELEVLENSHVRFVVVGDASGKELDQAVDQAPGDAGGDTDPIATQTAGADFLPTAEPVIPVATRVTPPTDETPAGADHLAPTDPVTGQTIEDARRTALDERQASLEGTAEPAIILTNNDPDQSKGAEFATNPEGAAESPRSSPSASLNREPFNAEATLDQPVSKITEDMDRFSDDQLRQLLEAERAGKNRGRLVVALETRLR